MSSVAFRKPISAAEKRRNKIWAETEGRCVYCNSSPPAPARTVDHLWPKCRGGTLAKVNLVGACKGCNEKRGTKIPASKHAHPKWQEHVRKKERAMGMAVISETSCKVISDAGEGEYGHQPNSDAT
jgi:5-methylcytosine-specific restriction endonuclease McrA